MTNWTLGPAQEESSTGGTWQILKIGAGGFITGIDLGPDGTKVIRTDTYGAYRWDGTKWVQLVTAVRMPVADQIPDNYAGVWEIRIAPSNTSIFYMVWKGYVYKSTDSGATWTKTAKTLIADADANGSTRTYGQNMAVDPENADVVYIGTPTAGVWYTLDAGANWTQIPTGTIPFSATGHFGIAFDPDSGTTDGKTNTIYVPSYGNGVWRTTNAGSSWSQISSSPTSIIHGKVANTKYYCAHSSGISKYDGSWLNVTYAGAMFSIAVDPFVAGHLIMIKDSGQTYDSDDDGANWVNTGYGATYRNADDIPWLEWTDESYMSAADIEFDLLVQNKLWFAEGIGVWYGDPSTIQSANEMYFNSQSIGIEQIVANWIWKPTGGAVYCAGWDRGVFRSTNQDVFPSQHYPVNYFNISTSVESAVNDPTFLVCTNSRGLGDEYDSYSDDSGLTWTAFAGSPAWSQGAGHIAVSTSTNWVWVPCNGRQPYYTKDQGVNWSAVTLPGVGSDWWNLFPNEYWVNRHPVCADRVTTGTFYIYHPTYGLFRTTDAGDNWTDMGNGPALSGDAWDAKLRAVPGNAGHLFYTTGAKHGSPHPVATETFQRSTDGGANWTVVSNVLEVWAFGFGKEAPGQSYPAVYIAGWVSSAWGIWRSDDNCSTWTKIGEFPLDSLDEITAVEGDIDEYGRVYIGFKGSGYAYYSP